MYLRKSVIVWVAALIVTNACVAFAVVYSKQKTRAYHIEVSRLRTAMDDLDIEWGRLQLEEGALSGYGRIESIAREQLNMKRPDPSAIKLVLE